MATTMGGPEPRVLARSSLFSGWPEATLASVASCFVPRAVRTGDVICRRGEPGDEMYIVESGRFAVEGVAGGRGVRFAELGSGAVFGEIAVVTKRPRSATVTALGPGQLWALRRADFERIAAEHPRLGVAAARIAADRLAEQSRAAPGREPQFAHEPQSVLTLQPHQDAVTIGRDERNDVVVNDPRVSRRHALLRRVDGGFRIEDLDSTNGIYVNGERVDSCVLRDGDQIRVGGRVFRFDHAELTHYARGRGAQVDGVGLVRVVGKDVTILSNVSLSVYPGELVAIVGGSGAGKTTLLNALSGVSRPTRGRVLYNGTDYYRHFQEFRQTLGYVPQDDIVHPELSVYRTLYYAARLRLPTDTTRQEIEDRIKGVLERLELTARRDNEVRKLSGGQRKRVSIGVELLTEPEIFYLDEPTSGLDPGLDLRMMELLRGLADQGRTVILTTHATRNVMLCDKVAFMARGGHLAYYGAPAEALAHFGVEDFVEIYTRLDPEGAPQEWAGRFRASDAYQKNVEQRLTSGSPEVSGPDVPDPLPSAERRGRPSRSGGPGFLRQLIWLSARFLAVLRGDHIALITLLAAAPITALMLSGTLPREIFAMTLADGGNARQALSLLFMLITASILLGGFVASRSIAEEGPIYARERLINLKIGPYVLSKAIVLSLFSVIQTAFLIGVTASRIDFPGGQEALRQIYGVILFTNLIATASGLAASALANNGLQATLALIVFMMVQMAVAGGIVPISGMDDVAQAMSLFVPGRWALSLLGRAVDINARLDAQVPKNNFADQFTVGSTDCLLWMAGLFVAFIVVAVVGLKRRDAR